jgi:N-acetylglucosamine-6-phosphate deacetylase
MDERENFFDLQVNGYAGVDFNADDLSPDDLHRACRRLRDDGVAGILATVITDDIDRMAARLATLARLRSRDDLARETIAGLHVEGPFINAADGYRGAHKHGCIRPADTDAMARLLTAGDGLVRMVTLAPEADPGQKVTRTLSAARVVVAAGHTDATLDQLAAAIDAGLTVFTHLGNGCPAVLPRHDNIIQRALHLSDRLWTCFIGDGVHVPLPALGNYLRCAGIVRAVIVTDAIAPAGQGPGRYRSAGEDVTIGPDLVARSADGTHLLGSVATMRQCRANLEGGLGLSAEDARLLTCTNPRKAIGAA